MPTLSVALITLNEAKNIARVLESVRLITEDVEIIVVDSGSTDETCKIAESKGATVYFEPWKGFADQKNIALSKCTGDYILSVDADEVPDEALIESIKKAISGDGADAYFVKRHAVYMGRLMKHAFCDTKLRLCKKSAHPVWRGELVHESLFVDAQRIKTLEGMLLHYSYENFEDHLTRSIRYARLGAEKQFQEGKRCTLFKLVCRPFFAFFKSYILKGGWRDGLPGFIVSKMRALDVFEKYLFLYELSR